MNLNYQYHQYQNNMKKTITKLLILFVLCLVGMQGNAQNVTIGPDNGSLITGQAGGNSQDSGILRGMASMWRHEQLALTMTTSDIANLTSAGELADPSCAIDVYNGNLIIGAGQTQTFVVVSLPKGYRITGYRLVLQPNIYGNGIQLHQGKNTWNIGTDDQMCFYETPAWSEGSPYDEDTGNTHSTQLTCPDAIATATYTAANGTTETVMRNNNDENRAKEFVITRTSREGDANPMTNQLHFFFARASSQYAVTIKSFEIFFTAEGSFDAQVAPAKSGVATDYVTSPFTTSKMDVGAVVYDQNLYKYDYTGVRDLKGYIHLYQDGAISGGKPAHVDANTNIYPLDIDGQGAFAFGNDVFFMEPPTTIRTSSGWEQPIGFRVVGATFNYKYGTQIPAETIQITNGLYIQGRNNQSNTTLYLDGHLDFQPNNNDHPRTLWQLDEYGNIYIGDDDDRQYLACFGSSEEERLISLSSVATGAEAKWNLRIDEQNHLYYTDSQNHKFVLNIHYIQEGGDWHNRGYVSTSYNTTYAATANTLNGTHTVEIPGFTPGAYTLKIYDKTGTQLATPAITVSSAADEGSYKLTGLNNDAVKFEITGLEEGKQALVDVTLELQALNPYINSMDIVCKDQPELFQMRQTFTSSDFRVSGGKFVFYIPSDYKDQQMKLSFADLFSDYGDNTYYGETASKNNSRYSFVTSAYYNATPDLYASSYSPNSDYTTKIVTTTAGNVRFKFNNAEDMTPGTNSGNLNLQEYAFDYNTYKNGGYTDPDGSGDTSEFETCVLTALETEQETNKGTYYVFTADETRYNIAPTTAWQHRYYAFYRMDIVLLVKDYLPELTWKKIYDKTCYDVADVTYPESDRGTEPAATVGKDSMWGLQLGTGEAGPATSQYGYLTYNSIITAMDAAIESENTTATGNVPTSKSQILYIDGSKLYSMVNSAKTTTTGEGESAQTTTTEVTLSDLKQGLADNALVFLPENTTSTLDNVAYISKGSFRAGKDIVLTDGKPFYSPYEIQVDAANEAIYKRTVQRADYEANILASMILPYSLTVNNGEHKNPDGTSFTIHEMKTATLQLDDTATDPDHNYGVSYFGKVDVNATNVNAPYMVNLDKESRENENFSFAAIQSGATIVATSNWKEREAGSGVYKYLFAGTPVNGTVNAGDNVPGGSIKLTPEGSYSGQIYDRAHSNRIFYFANNKFLNLYKLMASKRYLYLYPFRSVYSFEGDYAVPNSVKSLNGLTISFEDPLGLDGIRDMAKTYTPDLAVSSGKGFIQMTSAKEQVVNVFSLNGTSYSRVSMNAGDSKTVTLPAGVYVVNNVKIIVK